jgi:hypothetical protein
MKKMILEQMERVNGGKTYSLRKCARLRRRFERQYDKGHSERAGEIIAKAYNGGCR